MTRNKEMWREAGLCLMLFVVCLALRVPPAAALLLGSVRAQGVDAIHHRIYSFVVFGPLLGRFIVTDSKYHDALGR